MIDYERTALLLNVVHMSVGVDQASRHRSWAIQELAQIADAHAEELAKEPGSPVGATDHEQTLPADTGPAFAGFPSGEPQPVVEPPADAVAQNETDLAGHRLDNETREPIDPIGRKI